MEEDKKTEIMDYIANNKKLALRFQKLFNSFCGRCRQMCISNSNRPFEDYCPRCQEKARKILESEL